MNEELLQLLQEADSRGYDSAKKQQLVQFYLDKQSRSPQPAHDPYADLPFYMQPLQKGQPKQERPHTPLTAFAVNVYSGIADQMPEQWNLIEAYNLRSKDFDEELAKRYLSEHGIATSAREPEQRQLLIRDAKSKAKEYFYQRDPGASYYKDKADFDNLNKMKAMSALLKAKQERSEANERLEPFVSDTKDISGIGSALEYGFGQAGNILTQLPAGIVTGGMSSKYIESAYAYQEMVDEQAKLYGMTPQEFIANDLDKPILEYADAVGDINMLLENLGLLFGMGKAAKPFVKKMASKMITKAVGRDAAEKAVRKSILKDVVQGGVQLASGSGIEGFTEALQEITLIYQGELAKNKSPEEAWSAIAEQADRIWESFWAGASGTLVLGGLGRAASIDSKTDTEAKPILKQQEKVDQEKQKAEAKKAEERAKIQEIADKVDEIEASTTDEILNTGEDENFDDFLAKTKALAVQAKEEEIAKNVEKEEKKLQDLQVKEIEKVVDSQITEETKQITEETKQPTDEKSVTVSEDDVKSAKDGDIAQPITLKPVTEGAYTGLVQNSKGATWHERNTQQFKDLGYTDEQINNFSQKEATEILTNGIENPNVESSTKVSISPSEKPTDPEGLKKSSKTKTPVSKKSVKVEKQPKVAKKETKVKTEEGTINLETGEVKTPVKRGRKTTKKEVKESPTEQVDIPDGLTVDRPSVETEVKSIKKKNPNPADEQITAEQNKFKTMLQNQMKLTKPSQRLKRLKHLVETSIAKAKFPDQHQEVVEKAQKEIQAIEASLADKAETKAKVQAKKEAKKVEQSAEPKPTKRQLTAEQKQKRLEEAEARNKEIEALEAEKKTYTDKYAEVRDKTGNVISRAIPQTRPLTEELESTKRELKALVERKKKLKDKAPEAMSAKIDRLTEEVKSIESEIASGVEERTLWDPMDIAKIQEINDKIDKLRSQDKTVDMTDDQIKQYDSYKAEGLDDDTAAALANPVEDLELSANQLGIENVEQEDSIGKKWSDFTEISVEELQQEASSLANYMFKDMVNAMISVIKQATGENKFRVFRARTTSDTLLGEALRDDKNNFFVFLNKDNKEHSQITALHELNHIFEFAINALESPDFVLSESFQKMNRLFDNLKKDLEFKAAVIEGKLDGTFVSSKRNTKLTSQERIILELYKPGMYGLKNAREMVAEAMSNPEFMTLLANVQPTRGSGKGKPKTNYLKAIYDTLKEIVSYVAGELSRRLKVPVLENFNDSYLNEILNIFDEALQNPKVAKKVITDISQAAFSAEKVAPKDNKSKELIDKVFNRALKEDIKDLKQFKAFVTRVQQSIGVDFTPAQKAALTRKFNEKLTLDEHVTKAPRLIRQGITTMLGKRDAGEMFTDFDYLQVGQGLLDIDPKDLNLNGLRKYVNGAIAFVSNDVQGLREARRFYQDYKASTNVKDLLGKDGFQFKRFGWGKKMARYVNLPSFLANISKYSQEYGPKLMKYFHDPLAKAHSQTLTLAHGYIEELSMTALRNKLSDINFRRINAVGQILSDNPLKPKSLQQKVVEYKQMLQLRLRAAQEGELRGQKEEDVRREIEAFDSMVPELLQGGNPLSEGEMKYYNRLRSLMDLLMHAVKSNAEIAHNDEFVVIKNYLPRYALGSMPLTMEVEDVGTGEKKRVTTTGGSDVSQTLTDALHPITTYQGMTVGQSGFEKARTGGKGIYYDTNIHTVAARYFQSTFFDIFAAQEVQVIDKMFQGENLNKLKEEMTPKNVALLKNYLMDAIKSFRQPAPDYSWFTQTALTLKNYYQTAKIGTLGQMPTQLLAMVPAIAVQTGLDNTTAAAHAMIRAMGDPELKQKINDLLNLSSQIKIRDFFFEKYESVEDVARAGVAGQARRWADKAQKLTTASLTWSDKAAVALNFLSAFIEAGGKIEDPRTWDPEKIVQADLKYTLLQNVSSTLFVAPALRQRNSDLAAIAHGSFWSFKSFALNAMTNAWLATPEAFKGNKNAISLAAAHLTSALAFEATNSAVKYGYGAAALAAYAALTGKDYDEPEEYTEENLYERLTNAFYSFFFGGLPTHADAVVKFMIDKTMEIGAGEKKDLLFSPDNAKELIAQFSGIYGNMLLHTVVNPVQLLAEARTGVNHKEDTMNRIIGKMFAEWLVLAPWIPFRGDVAKGINTAMSYTADKKRKRKLRGKSKRRTTI